MKKDYCRSCKYNATFMFKDNVFRYIECKFFYISQKKSVFTSLLLSLREFNKSLPNTFIYESILIQIYVNANYEYANI